MCLPAFGFLLPCAANSLVVDAKHWISQYGDSMSSGFAVRELGSLSDMRAVAAASSRTETYEPAMSRDEADAIYARLPDATVKEPH